VKFPGTYPIKVHVNEELPEPSSSGIFNVSEPYTKPSSSSCIRQLDTQSPTEESIRDEVKAAILAHKGEGYVPFHGWDEKTGITRLFLNITFRGAIWSLLNLSQIKADLHPGLPRYAMICTVKNGFRAFCGKEQEYFRQVRTHFYPFARIMYQRARHGLMVIWMEAPTHEHTVLLNTDEALWNNFKAGWAFFKRWCDTYAGCEAVNIAEYLAEWKAAGEALLEEVEIEPPSCPLPPDIVPVHEIDLA